VKRIARYKVQKVVDRLKRQRRGVVISEKVYETFIKEDEVRRAGARYLNRALAENLFTPLSKFLLSHAETRNITVEVEGDRVVIHPTVRIGSVGRGSGAGVGGGAIKGSALRHPRATCTTRSASRCFRVHRFAFVRRWALRNSRRALYGPPPAH
jgi:hypothetical protein